MEKYDAALENAAPEHVAALDNTEGQIAADNRALRDAQAAKSKAIRRRNRREPDTNT